MWQSTDTVASARQHTLKNAINCSGTGLHSGAKVSMTLLPAPPDTGIVFRRTDIEHDCPQVLARWDNVVDTRLNTRVGSDSGISVGTVEHLMAALAGSRIDNAVIEIDGPEVPIMDGSSAPFVFLIDCAGLVEQDQPRRAIEILKPVTVGDDDRSASLTPSNTFSVSFEIEFDSPLVARQELFVDLSNGAFRSDICRARTFGFEHEVAELRSVGLARGGSLDNAIVIGGEGVLNEDGLRYGDEFVRHKILDSIGDLYLAGGALVGHFHGRRSGHRLNVELLRQLFADDSAWQWTTLSEDGALADAAGWDSRRIAASA